MFRKGDKVRHRTGGRTMIVCGFEDEWPLCEWLDDQNHPHRDKFDPAMLEMIREDVVPVIEDTSD